jgi:hypothetical protein
MTEVKIVDRIHGKLVKRVVPEGTTEHKAIMAVLAPKEHEVIQVTHDGYEIKKVTE